MPSVSPPISPPFESWRHPTSGPPRFFSVLPKKFPSPPPWIQGTWIPPEEPSVVTFGVTEAQDAKSEIDIVSYNILSLELTKDDYYRNLDGTVKMDDQEKRIWLLNKRVEKWMMEGKIIMLQEATYSFVMKHDFKRGRTLNVHLHDLMQQYGYECYYHFYNYVPKRDQLTGKIISGSGTCTLGLATLIPARQMKVVQSKLLRPWVNSEYTVEDLLALDVLTNKIESMDADDPEIPILQEEKETLQLKYRNTTPNYADRTVLMLALEPRRGPPRRCVIGNVHMPCQYRDPKVMVRIAVKTKKSILDWMEGCRLDCPLVLGGDFNSDPTEGSAAYRCFTGTLDGVDALVEENRYISAQEFTRSVTNEKWVDLMHEQPGGCVCTNYGFTKRNYEESLRKFKDFMESLAFSASVMAEPILQMQSFESIVRGVDDDTLLITDKSKLVEIVRRARKERAQFFKPRVLVLDHLFLRDNEGVVERVKSRRTFLHEIVKRTKGLPIPDIHGIKEPSDHLPIFLTLRWRNKQT